jgi:hypothetical protein
MQRHCGPPQPQLLGPKLEFARAALKYNDPFEAEKALGRIQGQDRKTSEFLQGKPEKGAKLLDAREDLDQLGNDGRAYYALIISACGRADEARRFAKAVDRQQLLPELRTSLDQAIGSLSASADVSPKQF